MSNDPGPAGKRVGPPDVPPVTIGELRFDVIHFGKTRGLGQNGGYLAATELATGKEIFVLKVYDVTYEEGLEEDVQDIFIEEMRAQGDQLLVVDEDGGRYLVDPSTRSSRPA